MRLLKSLLVLFCIIISSCSIIGKIPIPGAHITLESLWINIIERRVVYIPIESKIPEYPLIHIVPYINEILEENIMNIKSYIRTSFEYSYKRVPIGKIYLSYSDPFYFNIILSSLNQEIEKIVLKKCILVNGTNEVVNLLELPVENLGYNFSWWLNDGSSPYGMGSGIRRFNNKFEIIIEKRDDEYVDNITLFFNRLPINYEFDIELSITYELEIYFYEAVSIVEYEIQFLRKFEEYIPPSDGSYPSPSKRFWYEINIDEWNKYL